MVEKLNLDLSSISLIEIHDPSSHLSLSKHPYLINMYKWESQICSRSSKYAKFHIRVAEVPASRNRPQPVW